MWFEVNWNFYDSKLAVQGGYNMVYERRGEERALEGERLPAQNYWLMQTVLIRNLHVQTETLRRGTIKLGPVLVSVFTQLDSSKLRGKKGRGTSSPPQFKTSGPSHYASIINKLELINISQNCDELYCKIVCIARND